MSTLVRTDAPSAMEPITAIRGGLLQIGDKLYGPQRTGEGRKEVLRILIEDHRATFRQEVARLVQGTAWKPLVKMALALLKAPPRSVEETADTILRFAPNTGLHICQGHSLFDPKVEQCDKCGGYRSTAMYTLGEVAAFRLVDRMDAFIDQSGILVENLTHVERQMFAAVDEAIADPDERAVAKRVISHWLGNVGRMWAERAGGDSMFQHQAAFNDDPAVKRAWEESDADVPGQHSRLWARMEHVQDMLGSDLTTAEAVREHRAKFQWQQRLTPTEALERADQSLNYTRSLQWKRGQAVTPPLDTPIPPFVFNQDAAEFAYDLARVGLPWWARWLLRRVHSYIERNKHGVDHSTRTPPEVHAAREAAALGEIRQAWSQAKVGAVPLDGVK